VKKTFSLRAYQTDAITEMRAAFQSRAQRVVLCLPTGAGKTVVFSEMVRMAAERGTTTLVLTDRVELFEQTWSALGRAGVIPQRLTAGSQRFDREALVTVGMVETVARRTLEGYTPDLIIADEAHKSAFTKIYDRWPDAKVVGATATPNGKHFHRYFQVLVNPVSIRDLINEGHLMPVRAYQMQEDLSDLETKGGEFTDHSLFRHYNKARLYAGVIDQWRKMASDRKTIVFNVNIEHTRRMDAAFREAGIASGLVTSDSSRDERRQVLEAFRAGSIQVLNNCGILTTGYDEPSIGCVVMNRATKSEALWLQCCGRGSRPAPGKADFIVLDFGENHNRLGRWDADRLYTLAPPKKRTAAEAALDVCGVKACKECGAMLFASARSCEYCGEAIPAASVDAKLVAGSLVEVSASGLARPVPEHLVGRKVSTLSPAKLSELALIGKLSYNFVCRVLRTRGSSALSDFARLRGYSSGWVFAQMKNGRAGFADYTIKP
jgi:superfamily II DNA or RNA helicase